jgi:hypothetical protein
MSNFKVLSSGVDTLHLSARGTLDEAVMAEVEAARDQAKEEGEPVRFEVPGGAFLVRGHGARFYHHLLNSSDLDLKLGAGENFPTAVAELRSSFLHAIGPVAAVERVMGVLSAFHQSSPRLSVSRVDMYADVQGVSLEVNDLRRFVSRARDRGLYSPEGEVWARGRRTTGFRFGRGGVVGRIYDKSIEVEVSGKGWMWEVWGEDADHDLPVWRVEFECKREFLRSYELNGVDESLAALQDLWRYLTDDWLSLRAQTKDRRERRWPVDPVWERIQRIEIAPGLCGLVRRRMAELDEERTLSLMQGCLTSLAALYGWREFGQAWAMSRPLVSAQFEHRGRPFAAEVRKKEERRVLVADPKEQAA